MAEDSTGGLELAADTYWAQTLGHDKISVDPLLRRIISVIASRDLAELYRRTGITNLEPAVEKKVFELPLLIELARKDGKLVRPPAGLGLRIPEAYYDEAERNTKFNHVTARLELGAEIFDGDTKALRAKIVDALKSGYVKRLTLAAPLQPCLEESARDLALPTNRTHRGTPLDGNGIIVGIIDDGCALAHQDFLVEDADNANKLKSRIRFLWDQAGSPTAKSTAAGWVQPPDFGFGLQLKKADIDRALAVEGCVSKDGMVDADKVHDILDFHATDLASHGTHVMSIATGNGRSLMGYTGIASKADIVFVQLPQAAIAGGGAVLYDNILDGVMYVFARARELNVPAVVNISYGGYTGPHDGTTELESGMDEMLALSDRSIVVAAGNGFEADCHAQGSIRPGKKSTTLQWVIRPEDPTSNYLEIWYNGNTTLELNLTPPDGAATLGPVALHALYDIRRPSDQKVIGAIDHTRSLGNNDNRIVIILSSTLENAVAINAAPGTRAGIPLPPSAPAPSGIWKIDLTNTGTKRAEFHAWIERDATGGRGSARRQQSHFLAAEADPTCTLGGLATGVHTIAVGGYNAATREICRYSACGPTRAIGADQNTVREKPEVCAPAESDPPGRGTLCASSRRAQPTRMNGTSASAPHVAGLVALMYQYIRDAGRPTLTADEIKARIMQGAQTSQPLKYNRHQQANDARPHKQQDMRLKDLIGGGKLNIKETLKRL